MIAGVAEENKKRKEKKLKKKLPTIVKKGDIRGEEGVTLTVYPEDILPENRREVEEKKKADAGEPGPGDVFAVHGKVKMVRDQRKNN